MSDEPIIETDERGVEVVVKRASRFSREFLATVISLVTTAFGVVAALAWNGAIQATFNHIFADGSSAADPTDKVTALYIYAVLVTMIGVVIIIYLGRLATRIGAEPVEFKYPGVPKKS